MNPNRNVRVSVVGAYRFAGWFELGLGYSAHYLDKDDKDGESFKARGRPQRHGARI